MAESACLQCMSSASDWSNSTCQPFLTSNWHYWQMVQMSAQSLLSKTEKTQISGQMQIICTGWQHWSAFNPSYIPLDVVGSRRLLPPQGPWQHRSDRLHQQWEGVEADEPSAWDSLGSKSCFSGRSSARAWRPERLPLHLNTCMGPSARGLAECGRACCGS